MRAAAPLQIATCSPRGYARNGSGRPSSPSSGARSASAQPTSCCSAARQTGSRGDGAGNRSDPHARASCPDTQACAGWPITRSPERSSIRLACQTVSRAQRLTFLAIAAVIAIVAVVVLTSGGSGDDEPETTSATVTPTPTATATATTAPDETATPTPTATPKPQPPLLQSGKVTKLRFKQGD